DLASRLMLARQEPAVEVASEAIGLVGWLLEQGNALSRRVLHPAAVMDIAKQQIAPFLPPQRSFDGSKRATHAISQLPDGLGNGNDPFQFRERIALCAWRVAPRRRARHPWQCRRPQQTS